MIMMKLLLLFLPINLNQAGNYRQQEEQQNHVVHCWSMLTIEYQLLENATADEFDAAINSLS